MQSKILVFYIPVLVFLFFFSACSPASESISTVPTPLPHPEEHEQQQPEHITVSSADRSNLTCSNEQLFCVGLVTATGEINDNSFNQRTWEGVQRAETDLIAKIDYIETLDAKDIRQNIEHFAMQKYDVIVTVGGKMTDITKEMAQKYPSIHFLGVDQSGFEEIENASGITFSEKKIGYIAGALAAEISNTGTVGIVLPSASLDSAMDLKTGFELGVQSFSANTHVIATYHPGEANSSLDDPEWGKQIANHMIQSGADVIFSGDWTTGTGALFEAANHERVYCVGVGSELWAELPEAHPCLVSSIKRHIADGVFETIAKVAVSQKDHHTHNAELFNGKLELIDFSLFEYIIAPSNRAALKSLAEVLSDGSMQIQIAELDIHHHGSQAATEDAIIHIHEGEKDE